MKLLSLALFAVLASTVQSSIAAQTLPNKFYGRFDLDKTENFEEYLIAKDYSWFMRKIILLASITKVFEKGSTPGTFRFKNLTSKKDVEADNVVLGKEFQGEGLDSEQYNVLFTYDAAKGELAETRLQVGASENQREHYYYTIEGNHLVLTMSWKGVTCKHFYKRV